MAVEGDANEEAQLPPPLEHLRFKVGRTFRQKLIGLEKLASMHYKNHVHEISDYNNRSRGAGGVSSMIHPV